MMAALEGLWHESCILDSVTVMIASVAETHYNVYIVYCSNTVQMAIAQFVVVVVLVQNDGSAGRPVA